MGGGVCGGDGACRAKPPRVLTPGNSRHMIHPIITSRSRLYRLYCLTHACDASGSPKLLCP